MNIVNWVPKRSMLNLFDDFDKIVNYTLWNSSKGNLLERHYRPAMKVHELDDNFQIIFDLPGVKKKDINIEVLNGILKVSGERSLDIGSESTYLINESSFGKFARSIKLIDEVVEEKIKAEFKDGVLMLTVPKSKEIKSIGKKITIS